MSRCWMIADGRNGHWDGMLEVAGWADLSIYGRLLWRNFARGKALENGKWQPRTQLYGCSTRRTLSILCKCRIVVRFHPLCPKRAAAPWHKGAKSKLSTTLSANSGNGWARNTVHTMIVKSLTLAVQDVLHLKPSLKLWWKLGSLQFFGFWRAGGAVPLLPLLLPYRSLHSQGCLRYGPFSQRIVRPHPCCLGCRDLSTSGI